MSSTLDSTTRTADWSAIRAQLEEQRADCVQQREQALAECATSVPDPVALRRSSDLQDTIEEIDAALARIEAGTYGSCTACGSAIPQERLEFRPMARCCVACS